MAACTVCDMYREVIEHPWSLPEDIHAALDLERGRDRVGCIALALPDFKKATPGAALEPGQHREVGCAARAFQCVAQRQRPAVVL